MFNPFFVLAQQEAASSGPSVMEAVRAFFTRMDVLSRPDDLLDGLSQVPLILAGVFVIVGLLCVLNGYKWHRWVVVILAFIGGVLLGNMFALETSKSVIVAVALGALCAIIATPLLKVAVAVFGGITGAFIGANAWTALNTTQADSHWAGAAMGFILMAMASFLLFRIVIVVFTSVGGAAMLIFGGITLLMQVDSWEPAVREALATNQLILPLLLAVAAVGGFVLQSSWHPEAIKKAGGGDDKD
ncbi:MAG: hypothetical protein JSV91_08335 [Phycisphaerales bacterium]|nr:MAG: hypothetical protein JSV91_08335 [Phycisphaerales bacterium]